MKLINIIKLLFIRFKSRNQSVNTITKVVTDTEIIYTVTIKRKPKV